MRFSRIFIAFCLFFSYWGNSSAQEASNKGKLFWFTFPAHVDGTDAVMGIYITASVNTTGTLVLANGSPLNFDVQANKITRIFLNKTGTGTPTGSGPQYFASNTGVYQNQSNGVTTLKAIKITSTDPVVVYAHIIKSARSGATLLLPVQGLGNEYIAPSFASTSTSPSTANGTLGGVAQINVVATEPNTQVTIVPTANGRTSEPAGQPIVVNLPNAGDCYQFQSENRGDLSGTRITAAPSNGSSGCKPIAVFSGSTWSSFDCNGASGGDNLFQQLFPTKSWGKTFVTSPFINRAYDIYRIYPRNPGATVTIQDNGLTFTLGASNYNAQGNFYFYLSGNPLIIQSDEPISVAQFITSQTCKTGCFENDTRSNCWSDPEMVILNPVEQTLRDITFFSAHRDYVPRGDNNVFNTNVALHFVNVVIKKKFTASVRIDGTAPTANFINIPNSEYAYLQADLSTSSAINPVHRIVADSNFTAIVYGYGDVESYGYNGGANVQDFVPQPTLQNPFNRIDSGYTCVNTPFTFSIPLNYQPTTIQWDFTLAPRITPNGVINQTANITSDSVVMYNGQTIRYYSPGITYQFNQSNTSTVQDTVRLYTTSATPDGCGSTNQQLLFPIRVLNRPVSQASRLTTGCINDSVKIFSQSTHAQGKIARWRWGNGAGTTVDKTDSSYVAFKYNAAGTYALTHDVISDIGCASIPFTQTITLNNKPVAGWVVPSLTCINGVVTFSSVAVASNGTIATHIWNLDDGNGAFSRTTNAAVTTTYSTWGDRVPTLQIVLGNGCTSDVFSPTTPLRIHPRPEPGFISPAICLNDANALFQDTSKIADGSTGFTYLWNFNFASPAVSPGPVPLTSTQVQPTVTFNKESDYQVRLQVTSAAGCAAAITRNFTVNGTTPRADFNILNSPPFCSNQPISLKDLSSVNFGALTQLQIYWDVTGDRNKRTIINAPGVQQNYVRSFTEVSGNAAVSYSIRVVAYSGGNNCVDSVTKIIQVFPMPMAAFTATTNSLCFNESITFTDQSNGFSSAVQQWFWDLGKGQTSGVRNPQLTYTDSGNAVVKLYIKNADGCFSDTAFLPITIHPLPLLVLPAEQRILEGAIMPLKPDFVFGNNLSYLWTPGTFLSSDTAANPLCAPTSDILYTLRVTSQAGCSATDDIQIKLIKEPSIPNAFSPNGDGINDFWVIKYLEFYPDATIQIFNRYGQPVYLSTGYSQPWDGKFKGTDLPVGTYYYIINPRNGLNILKGAVTIIR